MADGGENSSDTNDDINKFSDFHGEFNFKGNRNKRKFVKVKPDADVKELCNWMKEKWGFTMPPSIVISVIGGAWDFPRNGVVKEVFRKGLVDAAVKSEGKTMVITGGTHEGVTKYTGRGLSEYEWATPTRASTDDGNKDDDSSHVGDDAPKPPITLGVLPWWTLTEDTKATLEANRKTAELTEVQKTLKDEKVLQQTLDPNHSHFIFIDENRDASTANQFRVNLEKEMKNIVDSTNSTEARKFDSDKWIFIDLTRPRQVKAVEIFESGNSYLGNKFQVLYKDYQEAWKPVDENREFNGVEGRYDFKTPVRARFFRIQPTEEHGKKPSMGIQSTGEQGKKPSAACELIVCQDVAVVSVLIEGGLNTIKQACLSIDAGIPLVVVADSGRAANVLANAFKDGQERKEKETEGDLKRELKRIIKSKHVEKTLTTIKNTFDKHRHLVNIYDGSTDDDIQAAILRGLMRDDTQSAISNLKLALQWYYPKAVEDMMFHSSFTYYWETYAAEETELGKILTDTILKNRLAFVKLFIDNDVIDMDKWATWGNIEGLYRKVLKGCTLPDHGRKTIETIVKGENILHSIGDLMLELASVEPGGYLKHRQNDYTEVDSGKKEDAEQDSGKKTGAEDNTAGDPFRHLFIFALLCGYDDMALYFCEEDSEPIASALVASILYKNRARKTASFTDEVKEHLEKKQTEFANLAYKSLDVCEEATLGSDTDNLLLRKVSSWGDTTCLALAERAENLDFLGHIGVQALMDRIWRGVGPDGLMSNKKTTQRKILSPQWSFYRGSVMHLLFLGLFSYIMLSGQRSYYHLAVEFVVVVWVALLVLEEIRQAITLTPLKYIKDPWNWNDMFSMGLFFIGFLCQCRLGSKSDEARIILAFSLFGFFYRLLHKLTPFKYTGPKVLMVGRMLMDAVTMLIIIAIVLIGYGVSTTAILYPHVNDQISLVTSILYRPYFQIYGDLGVADISASENSGTCTTNKTAIQHGALPCPEQTEWGLFALALWMIFSNVLLLNLLIAMFSNTYEDVQGKTELHWKYMRYTIIKEYFEKPILIELPYEFVHRFWMEETISEETIREIWKSPKLERPLTDDERRHCQSFEKQQVYNHIIKKRKNEQEKVRKEKLPERLAEVESQLEAFRTHVDGQFAEVETRVESQLEAFRTHVDGQFAQFKPPNTSDPGKSVQHVQEEIGQS